MGAKTNLQLTWWFEVANHSHSTALIYSGSLLRTCSIVLRSDKCWLQAEPTFTSNIFLNLDEVKQRNCEVVVRPVVWTKFGYTCPQVSVWCSTGCRSYDELVSIFTWSFFVFLMQECRKKYLFLLLGPPWTICPCQFFFSTHSNTQIIIFSDMEWGREQ